MRKILNQISDFYWCKILGVHDWTCKADQGIKPTEEDLYGGYEGLKSYTTMYCKKCEEKSKLTL